MTVRFAGEPNCQLVEEALRRLLMAMTPEERAKYAYRVDETTQNNDRKHIRDEKSPQNRI